MNTSILALDLAGTPFSWLTPQEAIHYYATDKIAWELGEREFVFRGGFNKVGSQSILRVKPIIAIARSEKMARKLRMEIPLARDDNTLLFRRDRYTCAYCGDVFERSKLSRDHVVPRSRGGADNWQNCVTACITCNQSKKSKMVHEFRPLLYVPYSPCRSENYILQGRNILADQHDYLAMRLPAHSRVL
jgi:hypothetical protein